MEFEFTGGDLQEVPADPAEPAEGADEAAAPPILIFLIPGIRSSGRWAHRLKLEDGSLLQPNFKAFLVRPYGRLGLRAALFRRGFDRMRREVRDQILARAREFPHSPVNAICHSMGSALFAEVVGELRQALEANGKSRIDKIVFLGSVCHESRAQALYDACCRPPGEVYNDVGTRDRIPLLAHAVRPSRYGPVGSFGFGLAYVSDRFYSHDHSPCTEARHINDQVLPLILENLPKMPTTLPPPLIDRNLYDHLCQFGRPALGLLMLAALAGAGWLLLL